jgi:4-hydroxybenzoate polyprenyltransferase
MMRLIIGGLLARALRPHQWAKNLLVFSACVFSHAWREAAPWLAALAAFAALSLCASAIYLLNDIVDARFDRLHPRKRLRPFASGALRPKQGVAAACLLFAGSALIGSALRRPFAISLAAYALLGLVYVFAGKRVAILDVIILSVLYTLRILAGGAATGIPISAWLLAFSMFFFLSIAFSKRCSEIAVCGGSPPGRPYGSNDPVAISGIASAYAAVVVLALYIQSPETARLYHRPEPLWVICPILLFWLNRLWLLSTRGQVDEDPVLFALKDWVSYAAGVVVVLLAALGL